MPGVAGTWKDLTDNVNLMASNLTGQVRNIAEVTTAVASGDLSRKITVDVKGEILELKNTINTMVDQLTRSRQRSPASPAKWAPTASWRTGRRDRRRGHVEGPAPTRQSDGGPIYRAGAKHRGSDGRRRQRRPLKKITVDVSRRDPLQLKDTMNTMVERSCDRSPPR